MTSRTPQSIRLWWAILLTVIVAVVFESVTISLRFYAGLRVEKFNKTAPLWQQIHHMFWSVPLLVILPFVWKSSRVSGMLLGISLGLLLSDLLHHFVIMPLAVGNTVWHWP